MFARLCSDGWCDSQFCYSWSDSGEGWRWGRFSIRRSMPMMPMNTGLWILVFDFLLNLMSKQSAAYISDALWIFFFFFCRRHVVLPPEVAKLLPKNRLLSEVISLSDLSVCCVNYNWLQNNFHIKKCMSLYLFIIWIFEGTSVACLYLMIWVKKSHDLRFLLFDKHAYVCICFLRELLWKMWFYVGRWWNWFTVISFS